MDGGALGDEARDDEARDDEARDDDLPLGVVVPDDAAGLEPDRRAWLAEQAVVRREHRRRRLRRLVLTRRWERFGLSGPLVVICLLVTAAFGGLAVAFVPRPRLPEPAPAALADVPVGRAGADPAPVETVGGGVLGRRLPAVTLNADVRTVASADLRPAVVLLVTPDCSCAAVLKEVYRQAREFRLVVWLVGHGTPGGSIDATVRRSLVKLDESGTGGGARWAVDPDGTLFTALGARGTTLVAVAADGRVAGLRRDLPLDGHDLPALEPLIAGLGTVNR